LIQGFHRCLHPYDPPPFHPTDYGFRSARVGSRNSPMSRPTILLTGGSGQLGAELARLLAPVGNVVSPTRSELDLEDEDRLRDLVRSLRPGVIVNAAAYTAVDRAEEEEARAHRMNATVPTVLAEEARRIGSWIVHFSTDYVFGGEGSAPRRESDPTHPLGAYGRTKLEGELGVRASGARCVILRTGWLYGARGQNFLRTILRAGSQRDELRVVADQLGSPTWTRHLAMVAVVLAVRSISGSGSEQSLYHVTSAGECSWHEFASTAVEQWFGPSAPKVTAIRSSEWPSAARRPAYSVLSGDLLEAETGLRLPHWRTALSSVLEDLRHSEDSATWVRPMISASHA
jgi:dTDP-4-dehydrorhamnose reductase